MNILSVEAALQPHYSCRVLLHELDQRLELDKDLAS